MSRQRRQPEPDESLAREGRALAPYGVSVGPCALPVVTAGPIVV
jgi:hypothetical protein